jgi:hypothetical protein
MKINSVDMALAKKCMQRCANMIVKEMQLNYISVEEEVPFVLAILTTLLYTYCERKDLPQEDFEGILLFLKEEYASKEKKHG